jgi:hypothetical protein
MHESRRSVQIGKQGGIMRSLRHTISAAALLLSSAIGLSPVAKAETWDIAKAAAP